MQNIIFLKLNSGTKVAFRVLDPKKRAEALFFSVSVSFEKFALRVKSGIPFVRESTNKEARENMPERSRDRISVHFQSRIPFCNHHVTRPELVFGNVKSFNRHSQISVEPLKYLEHNSIYHITNRRQPINKKFYGMKLYLCNYRAKR